MSPSVDQLSSCGWRELFVFSGSLWYSKRGRALEVDRAGLAGGQLGAVLVADVHRAEDRLADRAGVRQPLLGVAVHEAVALGAGVVLVDDRAPPLDHLLLHRDRARRGGVDDGLQRRQVVLRRARPRASFSMRTNIVGTTWRCVTL